MKVHKVAQGENLVSIAHQYRFTDWQTIYDHPDNADLRNLRTDPMVLAPGDEVIIPDKEVGTKQCTTGMTHIFQLKIKPCYFSVYLKNEYGEPFAGNKYELTIEGETFTGKTSRDGLVSHPVRPDVKEGELKFWLSDDPDDFYLRQIKIGHLDPVEDISGVQARLNNLGYDAGPVDGRMNETTKEAIKQFQQHIGHEDPSGEMDDQTREALKDRQNRH